MSSAYYQEHIEQWKTYRIEQKMCPHKLTLRKMNEIRKAMGLMLLVCPWVVLCVRSDRGEYDECGG